MIENFLTLTKDNPVAATIISLYGAGILAFFLRIVPSRIAGFLSRQLTSTIHLRHVQDTSWRELQIKWFLSFLRWHGQSKWFKFSRSIRLSYDPDTFVPRVVPGYGLHFFVWKSRLFWYSYEMQTSNSTTSQFDKEDVRISMLGRNNDKLRELVAEFAKPEVNRVMFRSNANGWSEGIALMDRPLHHFVFEDNLDQQLVAQLDFFYNHREWYLDRGLTYKLVILLHGVPGTGKTTLIKALATHFKKNIAAVSLTNVWDERLVQNIETVPSNSMIVIEDFDSAKCLHVRGTASEIKSDDGVSLLTLSGVLNLLQGAAELDGHVIIMTTNVLHKIDPAVYRPARVDILREVLPLGPRNVNILSQRFYPDYDFSDVKFTAVPASHLAAAYTEHRSDVQGYLASLTEGK